MKHGPNIRTEAGEGTFSFQHVPLFHSHAGFAVFLLAQFFLLRLKDWLPPHGLFLMEAALILGCVGFYARWRSLGKQFSRYKFYLCLCGVLMLALVQSYLPVAPFGLLFFFCLLVFQLWLNWVVTAPLMIGFFLAFSQLLGRLTGSSFSWSEQLPLQLTALALLALVYLLFRNEQRLRQQALMRLAGLDDEVASLDRQSRQAMEVARAPLKREEKLATLLKARSDSLYRVLHLLHYSFRPHSCLLYLSSSGGETLRLKEGFSESDDIRDEGVGLRDGIFGSIFKENSPIFLPDISDNYQGLVYYRRPLTIRSFAGVPLPARNGLRGALILDSQERGTFGREDEEVLVMAAEQIASLLESTSELKAYIDLKFELERFYKASTDLGKHLKLEDIFEVAMRSIREFVNVEFSAVVLRQPMLERNRIELAWGPHQVELQGKEFSTRGDAGLCSWVIRNAVPLDYHDLINRRKTIVLFNKKIPQPEGIRSLLVIPLRGRDAALGALVLASTKRERISKDEQQMAEVICNQVAISVQNGLMYEQVEKLATTDGLTGLYNHRTFQGKLSEILALADRYNHQVALLMIDIDHFKNFNDLYGHPVGDFVLKKIAALLQENLRKIDIVARYGGEEFALILPETERGGALHMAERIRRKVEQHRFAYEDLQLAVTLSIGVAFFPESSKGKEELIELADKALYAAKDGGRNRCVVDKQLSREEPPPPIPFSGPLG